MYGRVPEPLSLRSAAPMVPQTNQIYVCGMYGRVPEPWWLRSAAPMVTQTNQIYVYMQIVRGRLGEIYVYIALQASPKLSSAIQVMECFTIKITQTIIFACIP